MTGRDNWMHTTVVSTSIAAMEYFISQPQSGGLSSSRGVMRLQVKELCSHCIVLRIPMCTLFTQKNACGNEFNVTCAAYRSFRS